MPVPAAWMDLFGDGPALTSQAATQAAGEPAVSRRGAPRPSPRSRWRRPLRWWRRSRRPPTEPRSARSARRGTSPARRTPSAASASRQSWSLATGKGVTVAVVDSGVDSGNAHLRGAVLPGTSFVPGPADRGPPRPRHRRRRHHRRAVRRQEVRAGRSGPAGQDPARAGVPGRGHHRQPAGGVPAGHRPDGAGHRLGGAPRRRRDQRVDEHPAHRRRASAAQGRAGPRAPQGRRRGRLRGQPGPGRGLHPGPLPGGRSRRHRGGRDEPVRRGRRLVDPRAAERRVRARAPTC